MPRAGCNYEDYLRRISNNAFNLKTRNIVSIVIDNISTSKREHADQKRSGRAKKVKNT